MHRFQGLLTLFPKFFSPFLHSTCSLSVSWLYLALQGVYPAIRAAIPSCFTQNRDSVKTRNTWPYTRLSLSMVPFSKGAGPYAVIESDYTPHLPITPANRLGIQHGLFHLHSPLLMESLLVSFPPLINMLKSSGWVLPASGIEFVSC